MGMLYLLHSARFALSVLLRISEQSATFAVYIFNLLVFITAVESVYSAVRTDSLYSIKQTTFRIEKVKCAEFVSDCCISHTSSVVRAKHIFKYCDVPAKWGRCLSPDLNRQT
jgi:hypothetical protein